MKFRDKRIRYLNIGEVLMIKDGDINMKYHLKEMSTSVDYLLAQKDNNPNDNIMKITIFLPDQIIIMKRNE